MLVWKRLSLGILFCFLGFTACSEVQINTGGGAGPSDTVLSPDSGTSFDGTQTVNDAQSGNDLQAVDIDPSVDATPGDDSVCVPNCDGKECGYDGCEGSCGSCPSNYLCSGSGQCTAIQSNTDGNPACILIEEANSAWSVCESAPDFCAGIFEDQAGCAAFCAAAGLECVASYDDLPNCEKDLAVNLGCAEQTGYTSEYCECGLPVVDPPDDPPAVIFVAEDVRYVRVHTTQSPSWVAWSEIEVHGVAAGSDAEPSNLALNTTVTASSGEASGGLVVDGDPSTSWNAGDFPPAIVTIDLGMEVDVTEIRLQVTQNPPGLTHHTLELAGSGADFTAVHTFVEYTQNGQWLVYPPEGGVEAPPVTDPSALPRGIAWVRNNPMFISGLCVSTGPPSAAAVHEYYDEFHATAAHLWNDGITSALPGWEAANHPDARWLSWVRDNGTAFNNEVIGGLAPNHPGRIGYQVGDEPGLHGDGMEELQAIEVGVDAVRAADPEGLIVINFSFWAEEIEEMLDYFGSQMDADIYSYDRYSMGYQEHETMAMIRTAGLTWNRPYWRYLKSYHDVGTSNELHATDYRWTAFVGLLYGFTGHTWFVYQAKAPHAVASDLYDAQGGFEQGQLEVWHTIAQLNLEMRNLGRAITQMTSTDVRYVPGQSLYLPDGLVAWSQGAGGDSYITTIEAVENDLFSIRDLAVGFFTDDDGEIYVMIQNQQHKNAQFPIDNLKASTVRVTFDFSGAPANLDTSKLLLLDHTTGNQLTHSLQPIGNGLVIFEKVLSAGDPVFFKYSTGQPFPLGP